MIADPPGQIELWRPEPATTARWWRVVGPGFRSDRIRLLPFAASMAAAAAEQHGEAWLVADDHSSAHVDHDGVVTPTTGWAMIVARTIDRRTTTP